MIVKQVSDTTKHITDDPNNPAANVSLYVRGGGTKIYTGFSSTNPVSTPQLESRAELVRNSPTGYTEYERRLPDGSKEIFNLRLGTTFPRKIFMTRIVDPAGNTVTLTYDANFRLISVADALNPAQVTTLSYEFPTDNLKITKVTDPYGRFATFEYYPDGQLKKITDVIGINNPVNLVDPDGRLFFALIVALGAAVAVGVEAVQIISINESNESAERKIEEVRRKIRRKEEERIQERQRELEYRDEQRLWEGADKDKLNILRTLTKEMESQRPCKDEPTYLGATLQLMIFGAGPSRIIQNEYSVDTPELNLLPEEPHPSSVGREPVTGTILISDVGCLTVCPAN